LLYGLKTRESGVVFESLAALLDGNAGTAHYVPRKFLRLSFLDRASIDPRDEGEPGFTSKPTVHSFGIAQQCECPRGEGVEDFTNRCCSMFDSTEDLLGNIIGVNMVSISKPRFGKTSSSLRSI
jgi:hypothetical protein